MTLLVRGQSPMHGVSETELRILNALWDDGEQTVRQIAETVFAGEVVGRAEIGTIHSLIGRLVKKNLVRRSRRTHPHRFSAKVSMQDIAGGELEALAQKVSQGSLAPFLMHLIANGKLTKSEADEIRVLLKNYQPSEG